MGKDILHGTGGTPHWPAVPSPSADTCGRGAEGPAAVGSASSSPGQWLDPPGPPGPPGPWRAAVAAESTKMEGLEENVLWNWGGGEGLGDLLTHTCTQTHTHMYHTYIHTNHAR